MNHLQKRKLTIIHGTQLNGVGSPTKYYAIKFIINLILTHNGYDVKYSIKKCYLHNGNVSLFMFISLHFVLTTASILEYRYR